MTDVTGAAPETRNPRFIALLFGASAAPIFWLGQLVLQYGVSAFVCYPADHPVTIAGGDALQTALTVFDVIAIAGALAGLVAAFVCLRRTTHENASAHQAVQIGEGRSRFIAIWGVFSSACFLLAILFNVIASAMVPLCVH